MPKIVNYPIVSREKIIFPLLHIKLGLVKQFVRTLNTDDECLQQIIFAFPATSFERIEASVPDEPQIRELVCDKDFVRKMNKDRGT